MGENIMFNSRIWSKKLKEAKGPEEKDEVILSMFEEIYSGNTLATKSDLALLKAELINTLTARTFVIVALLNGILFALIQITK